MEHPAIEDPGGRGAVLFASVEKSKRQAVVGACERCRSKKIKCDGQRPCSTCTKKNVRCIFTVEANESHQEARKRKFGEVSQAHNEAQDVLSAIANSDEKTALELFNGIRRGQSVAAILRDSRKGSESRAQDLDHQQRRKLFIMALVHSTAPLRDVIALGTAVLNGSIQLSLPTPDAYAPVRDTIVYLESIGQLLQVADPDITTLPLIGTYENNSLHHVIEDGIDHGPVVWVSATPWLNFNISDIAASHLISIFLHINNPFWRYVKQDLFVKAMRSGDRNSKYCSPLLVNSILALASVWNLSRTRGSTDIP